MSSIFAESANRLPKEAKAKLPKAFMLLTNNPRHPSLQVKKIEGAVRRDVYECRLDQAWRIILKETGETYDLVYVGAHDEAISYGARLRESGATYGSDISMTERLKLYLAGDDQVLEFVDVTVGNLERLTKGKRAWTYHVYENWRAEGHKARIHVSHCPSCNNGEGVHPGSGDDNGRWHGPFKTFQEAFEAAENSGRHISECKRCHPR